MTAYDPSTPCRYCGAAPTRLYGTGPGCPEHTAAKLAGHAEPPTPDPALTLDGIRAAKGLLYGYRPSDTALNDQEAIATGKRRASLNDYRNAQRARAERKRK